MPGNYETMKILGSLYSNSEDMEKKEMAKVLYAMLIFNKVPSSLSEHVKTGNTDRCY